MLGGVWALVQVALELGEGFGHGVGAGGAAFFAFDDDQGDAVDEEDDVGNDEGFDAARSVDAELIDGVELVVFGMVEVDEFNDRVLFAGEFVDIDLGFDEKFLDGFVGFEQGAVGLAEDLVLQVLELFGGKPGGAVGGGVEGMDGLIEEVGQEPLAKVDPQAFAGVLGNALALVDDLPAQALELFQEGLFYFGVFRHRAGDHAGGIG